MYHARAREHRWATIDIDLGVHRCLFRAHPRRCFNIPGVMSGMKFPVLVPLAGPIYSEREKSAMEKPAAQSTLSSAFISASGQ